MTGRVLWMGGVHGVGKSSVLDFFLSNCNESTERIHLGRLVCKKAQELGYTWEELFDGLKMREAEGLAVEEIFETLRQKDAVFDAHFCIYFKDGVFPGFSDSNFGRILSVSNGGCLVNLVAAPSTVLYRRTSSTKKKNHYLTMADEGKVKHEIEFSNQHFLRLGSAARGKLALLSIDTSHLAAPAVAEQVRQVYRYG